MSPERMETLKPDDIKPYLEMGIKAHLKSMKLQLFGATIEVEFGPHFQALSPTEAAEKIGMEHNNPTEDELLFMSAGGGPIISTEPLNEP